MMLSIQGQDIISTLTFILFSEKNLEYNPNTYVEKYIDICVIIMLFIYIYIYIHTSTLTFILFSEQKLEYNPNTYVEK